MDNNLTLHIKKFNDKVRLLNSANQKQLVLTAQEARSLHSDIQDLLIYCTSLNKQISLSAKQEPVINIQIDGGQF